MTLLISYKDHVTNEEVPLKIQQAIGPHEDLLTIVKSQRATENREEWRKLVMKSSVVPLRPLWLRDRLEETLDEQCQRVDVLAYARTAQDGLPLERLEEDLC